MSSRFEKPLAAKHENSLSLSQEDLTDWERVEAMDDEDIVFTEDSPRLPADFAEGAVFRVGGRPGTPEELADFKRRLYAYLTRPRRATR